MIIHQVLPAMLAVAAMFVLFGFLRPGEDCAGHCRTCTGAGCSSKRAPGHE